MKFNLILQQLIRCLQTVLKGKLLDQIISEFHKVFRNCSAEIISTPFITLGYLSNETIIALTAGKSSWKAFNPLK